MTREDSIRLRTWVTDDGSYLTVGEITEDHLRAIAGMLRHEMTPGYDETNGREMVRRFMAKQETMLDYTIDLELDEYRSAWLQLIDEELARRQVGSP